ncbi:MAG TPA: multidrug efflux SMR transporter [Devosiaceae bacterium]|jgi:small multidrug resistance pump
MAYVYLLIAICAEVIATSALKASNSFTVLWPSVLVAIGYVVAFFFLSLTLRTMQVGVAYAIWSGLGIIAVSVIAFIVYKQVLDAPAIIGMVLILAGVLVINLFSKTAGH